jgi:hypothetical protein
MISVFLFQFDLFWGKGLVPEQTPMIIPWNIMMMVTNQFLSFRFLWISTMWMLETGRVLVLVDKVTLNNDIKHSGCRCQTRRRVDDATSNSCWHPHKSPPFWYLSDQTSSEIIFRGRIWQRRVLIQVNDEAGRFLPRTTILLHVYRVPWQMEKEHQVCTQQKGCNTCTVQDRKHQNQFCLSFAWVGEEEQCQIDAIFKPNCEWSYKRERYSLTATSPVRASGFRDEHAAEQNVSDEERWITSALHASVWIQYVARLSKKNTDAKYHHLYLAPLWTPCRI